MKPDRDNVRGSGIYLAEYARYLRDKTDENALLAVHQFTDECNDLPLVEKSLSHAKKILDAKPGGFHAYYLWQGNQTAHHARVAFTVLTREGKDIPEDLLEAVLIELDKQIEDYKTIHPQVGTVSASDTFYHELRRALENRTGTKADVFREYAGKIGHDPKKLRDSYKKWEKRKP